jgi:metallophosphoesterase superfamily enzyme
MIGKSTLEDLPKLKDRATKPLWQVNMDSFSSSVTSIEGYNHAVVIADCHTGYRRLYGMNVKSDMLKVVKKWYSDIADLRQKHKLVVVMRDNAGENKSHEIIEYFESIGVKNYFSTAGRMDFRNRQLIQS